MCACVHACTDTCRDKDISYTYHPCLGHFLQSVTPTFLHKSQPRCFAALLRRQETGDTWCTRGKGSGLPMWWEQSLWQAQDISGTQYSFDPGLGPPRSFVPLCLVQSEEKGPGWSGQILLLLKSRETRGVLELPCPEQ